LLVAGLCLLTAPARAATNDLTSALQRGLFEEEANQNLGAAIQAYQTVANQFDKDRKLAATAIFRLGECYRKQGNTNDAAAQYERILREFSDQPTLVTLSRQSLAGLGSASAAPGTPILSDAARQEQKRLLEQEIKLVEKQLESQQKQVQAGVLTPDALLVTQRDLLKVKRQLAALDAGLPVSITATETLAPPTSTEAEEVKRIQAMIKDSPDLINAKDSSGTEKTPLSRAAGQGQLVVGQFLLANGADVDAKDRSGETPLHDAARGGHKAMLELLLSHKADVQASGDNWQTPLHLAARNGFRSVVEVLLAHRADVNAKMRSGSTPLLMAVANGFRSVAELLLAHGADANASTSDVRSATQTKFTGTALHVAATRGDQALVELLLANKADVTATNDSGNTPLHLAAESENLAIASALMSHGADANAKNPDKGLQGWTPLHCAVNFNQKEMVALLLKNKADPNARIETSYYEGGGGYTPLLMATIRVFPDIVDLLLASNADPNLGNDTRAPILNVMNNENPVARQQMLKSLLQHGAALEARDSDGHTPLLLAAWRADKDAMALLLANKADVNAQNKTGLSPLHALVIASQNQDVKPLAELLLAAGADVNARNVDGVTPLHLAVEKGKQDLVDLLLANKADPNARNKAGQTPLDLAEHKGPSPGVPLNYQWRAPGQPGNYTVAPPGVGTLIINSSSLQLAPSAAPSSPASMADLLRQHGASDDLPRPDCIELRRPSVKYSSIVFTKGTNIWNQFSLLELIAVHYSFLAGSPAGESRQNGQRDIARGLSFPDFARLRIRRPSADLKSWEEKTVDLITALKSTNCAADVHLAWGDVIEIPESDHPLDQSWPGFPMADFATLKTCLTRQVEIVIKGQGTNITLAPDTRFVQATLFPMSPLSRVNKAACWIKPVLRDSGLLLASSDLSRVKVTRRDPATGQKREWVVDCSEASPAPDLWLRDGDKIEVPDKTNSASAEEATSAPPSAPGIALPPPAPAAQVPRSGSRTIPSRVLRVPPSETPPAVEEEHLNIGGVLYSPKPDDPELLKAAYHKDRSAKTRKAESWEQRAGADLKGRACSAVWTGTDMIVFGGEGIGTSFDDGARYCFAEDTWALLPKKGGPSSRTGHNAVWTGKEMIIWGGFGGVGGKDTNRNDGARYNSSSDTWKPVTTKNAPAARFDFPAVWTGREMLVWGGFTDSHSRYQGAHADAHLNTGGRYDPSSDSWKTITTKGAPSKRCWHTMVWTGKEMIIWGGGNTTKALNDGGCYSLARDSWKPVSTEGAPSPRVGHVAVWTGKEMIVWGGTTRETDAQSVYFENGARYNPDADTWKPISTIGAPKGRVSTFAVWTGTEMVVWGGVNDAQAGGVGDSNRYVGTGARYNPATDTWTEMTATGAPSPRLTSGVWTGEGLLTFGGYNGTHLNDTWFYSPQRTLYPYAK
jgi:ankyrin repeat protein/N-acetylneuraminic acid mutarotase